MSLHANFCPRILAIALLATAFVTDAEAQNVTQRLNDLREQIADLTSRREQLGESTDVTAAQIDELTTSLDAFFAALEQSGAAGVDQMAVTELAADLDALGVQLRDDRIAALESASEDARQQLDTEGRSMLDHFGVGISLTSDLGGSERIDKATIVNGIVRVEEDSNVRARVMLEWHVMLACERLDAASAGESGRSGRSTIKQGLPCDRTRRSSGLFIAVQPGSDSVIDAIGAGWMWRLPDKLGLFGDRALNIGFGLISDSNVQVLGGGFEPNQPVPTDSMGVPEETVRFRSTDQTGFFLMASIEVGNSN